MSSHTWTQGELSFSLTSVDCGAWRVVEAQHYSSTMKLTDTLDEQGVLERLIENTKPPVPDECRHLNFLLSAPFRYRPYPTGSRFRKAGNTAGVFYCAAASRTAIAELAFYRVLFFAESPDTPWPSNPSEYTAFAVALRSDRALDLTGEAFDNERSILEHLTDYSRCQQIETSFRTAGGEILIYKSVRDQHGGINYAVLKCSAFGENMPTKMESWRIYLSPSGVRATRDFPKLSIEFDPASFNADPRVAGMNWVRA
ncbi:MAG: RES family NAD+ phosphorylase [Beijerinckiaceae bacterium]|nr:RES family NAD+ phosphorylase [Beijerinckiaceae bacterium]